MPRDEEDLFGFGRAVVDRLDRIIDLLSQTAATAPLELAAALSRELRSVPAAHSTRSAQAVRADRNKHRRGVSPTAYRQHGVKILAVLLADRGSVGKLAVSLERECKIQHTMLSAILHHLQDEGVLTLSSESRGVSRFVRLVSTGVAEKRLAAFKEEIQAEAESLLSGAK